MRYEYELRKCFNKLPFLNKIRKFSAHPIACPSPCVGQGGRECGQQLNKWRTATITKWPAKWWWRRLLLLRGWRTGSHGILWVFPVGLRLFGSAGRVCLHSTVAYRKQTGDGAVSGKNTLNFRPVKSDLPAGYLHKLRAKIFWRFFVNFSKAKYFLVGKL